MSEHARNRLLGWLVLLSLAIMVVPMLFDGPGVIRTEVGGPPEMATPELAERALAEFDPDAEVWDFVAEAARARDRGLRVQAQHDAADGSIGDGGPGLDATGLPRAWSLQVGRFETRERALALQQQLAEIGHRTYLSAAHEQPSRYRVFVGPLVDREVAQQLQLELAALLASDVVLKRFRLPGAGE